MLNNWDREKCPFITINDIGKCKYYYPMNKVKYTKRFIIYRS